MKKLVQKDNFIDVLRFIKKYFSDNKIDWMIVSGMAVYLYNNPERKPTDIDIVVKKDKLTEMENILSRSDSVDHLRRVNFISKFGMVRPLGLYLEMKIMGINVHISNEWVWKLDSNKIIKVPFDANAFSTAKVIKTNGLEIKVARPELVFLCKSISRRTYKKNGVVVEKDLNDCKLLISSNLNFEVNKLTALFDNLGLQKFYNSKIASLLNLE